MGDTGGRFQVTGKKQQRTDPVYPPTARNMLSYGRYDFRVQDRTRHGSQPSSQKRFSMRTHPGGSAPRTPASSLPMLPSAAAAARPSRSSGGGGAAVSSETAAPMLLRACQVSQAQCQQLLAPLQHRLPSTEVDFQTLPVHLRRMDHVIEHRPGNVASTIGNVGG